MNDILCIDYAGPTMPTLSLLLVASEIAISPAAKSSV